MSFDTITGRDAGGVSFALAGWFAFRSNTAVQTGCTFIIQNAVITLLGITRRTAKPVHALKEGSAVRESSLILHACLTNPLALKCNCRTIGCRILGVTSGTLNTDDSLTVPPQLRRQKLRPKNASLVMELGFRQWFRPVDPTI